MIEPPRRFAGFRPLDANFIYTPNQFFELCLPRHSRGCVRLVAYLLRRTLGWLGPDGRPIEQRIAVTWRQLIDEAGVSRGAIAGAVEEATAARYVRIARRGRAKAAGVSAETARYELRWDDSGEWRATPGEFRGFFTGEGRRSPVPDAYFDEVVRREPLATARVVGVVLRQTIGYQNQFGGRRQQAALSFSDLQRRCGIADRKKLCKAVHDALDVGYLSLASEGRFDPDAGRTSAAAEYGVRWLVGPETPPARPRGRSKNPTRPTVQKAHRGRSSNPTGDGSETQPAFSKEGKTTSKNTCKQRPADAAVAEMLEASGFAADVAAKLAAKAGADVVRRQLDWLPRRTATRNRLGLLRRAILEDWAEPTAPPPPADDAAARFAGGFYAGLAGAEGASVAEPTAADLRAARRLCDALPPAAGDAARAAELGRALGRRVRHDRQSVAGATPPPSLAGAARGHGDRFVIETQARERAASEQQLAARREAHRARFAADHRRHLLDQELALRDERPADAARFDRWRDRQRERLAAAPPAARDALLAHWAGDAARLDDFVAFFDAEAIGFWAWDQQHNTQPFEGTSAAPDATP